MRPRTSFVVYTGGTFDLLHAGHVDFLRQCYIAAGHPYGQVIVGLNTDEFVEEFKGRRPVCSYEERAEVLQAIRYVSKVIPNVSGADSKPAILEAKPDLVIIGSDWAPETGRDYYAQMQFTPTWLYEHGIELCYVNRQREISTTDLRRRVTADLDADESIRLMREG
jgi:glycerol-3-phosphate cytidylyltransferase